MSNHFEACRTVTIKYEGEQCERVRQMAEFFGNKAPQTCTTRLNNTEWCESEGSADEAKVALKRITEGLCQNSDIDEPIPTCELGDIKVNKNRFVIFKDWVGSLFS